MVTAERACEWPDGCRHVSMPDGERWLCLRHAGAEWNRRMRANRAAGLCPCGAEPTPGYRTCARCRERSRTDRRRSRAFAKRAAASGYRGRRGAGVPSSRRMRQRSSARNVPRAGHGGEPGRGGHCARCRRRWP